MAKDAVVLRSVACQPPDAGGKRCIRADGGIDDNGKLSSKKGDDLSFWNHLGADGKIHFYHEGETEPGQEILLCKNQTGNHWLLEDKAGFQKCKVDVNDGSYEYKLKEVAGHRDLDPVIIIEKFAPLTPTAVLAAVVIAAVAGFVLGRLTARNRASVAND